MTLQAEGRKLVNVGNYRLTGKRLGKGNFARVEEAVHSVLNTKVALKVMDVNLIKEDYVIRNLYREARIMSRLFHPCIAALFQTMQFGNLYYLVMELVGGGDLCTYIKSQRTGKLDERCTRIFARQLVSAIAHVHNMGIVHRDLKMENVMLNSIHTQIKIVDFGLSNLYTESNPLRTHCGSPEYAAPELFVEGKLYGPEVDLWSLGVILYGMVIGQLPFVSVRENNMTSQERRKKLLAQINKGIAAPHRRALCLFSPEFKTMMGKLLIADRSRRLTIKQLIFHPWITEKGLKAVRSNPLKKLDGQYRTIVLKDVGSLTHLSLDEVEFAIKSEPQGNITGIYNILSFRHTLHQIEGDGITRNKQEAAVNYLTPRPRTHHAAKPEFQTKIASPIKRKDVMKSAPVNKVTSTPRTPLTRQAPSKSPQKTPSGAEMSLKKRMIPKILLSKMEKVSSARADLSPIPSKRNAYSGGEEHRRPTPIGNDLRSENPTTHPISNILNLTRIPSVQAIQTPKNQKRTGLLSPSVKKEQLDKIVEDHKETRIFKLHILNANKATLKNVVEMRIQSANADCKKSDPPPACRRPLTGPSHTAERAIKRRSMLPVTTSASAPSKAGGGNNSASAALKNRKQGHVSKLSDFREKPPQIKIRDPAKLPATTPSKTQTARHFVNEPIARSIAGYVVNNIPSKLNTFKWGAKASKKESS